MGYWNSEPCAEFGIDDQLRVRQVLLQDVGVDGIDDDVVAAVDDQRGLLDVFQIIPGVVALGAPSADRGALRLRRLLAHFGIAVLAAQPEALDEFASGRLAFLGRREMHAKPEIVRVGIGCTEDFFAFRRASIHTLTAARSGADQN